ncbi:uncharacterized protein LOC106712886 [Papilio machaon]|uniref:uncharacterized protein LOC106712886 n=1 Tax=Papilio machaon TaxID=76193 RepID=UPI001E665CB3|nr:uncharacterized protein LOC106712886 [Papilio machaon]
MKKHKQSLFTKKFDNLDCQENNDDILWSSSESSDCENKSITLNNSFSNSRKRKRKKKVNHNISNLNIIEVSRNVNFTDQITNETQLCSKRCAIKSSPILNFKSNKQLPVSPVLESQSLKSFRNDINIPTSPILTSKLNKSGKELSPVLQQKPHIAPNVKKKLFNEGNQNRHVQKLQYQPNDKLNDNEVKSINNTKQLKLEIENITDIEVSETSTECGQNNRQKTKFDLIKQVQSYFDSHFSSESLSQQSISECESTPQNISKSIEDVEITNSITQVKDIQPNQQNSFLSSCEITEKTKKRYKKNGLAYRLAGLIKKQNSNICLWQHEKFLATNSNFVIPTCEHWVFRIQNVQLKYGCYLIEAKDLKDEEYIIIINLIYITCNFIAPNCVIKLYKPYNLLEIDNVRVIVNVCKFECLPLKM